MAGPSTSNTGDSLRLYLSETEPSGIEKRTIYRWILFALLVLALHLLVLWLAPHFSRPAPPAPVEITQIDPAKLAAVKNKWKQRGFLLSKNEPLPKEKAAAPKDARYESDRNRTVEKEMRARQTNVIPNVGGKPEAAGKKASSQARAKTAPRNIPLSALSNFQSLPPPGPTRAEQEAAERQGRPGETGDQALDDRNLPVGAENMLNTVESVYYSFYARIYEQIGPLWQSRVREELGRTRLSEGNYTTRADIVFDSEGNYVETRLMDSSGVPALDRAVAAAWARVPRFPNPPRDLIQSDGKIHMGWSFSVQIDRGMNWNYVPPERTY